MLKTFFFLFLLTRVTNMHTDHNQFIKRILWLHAVSNNYSECLWSRCVFWKFLFALLWNGFYKIIFVPLRIIRDNITLNRLVSLPTHCCKLVFLVDICYSCVCLFLRIRTLPSVQAFIQTYNHDIYRNPKLI